MKERTTISRKEQAIITKKKIFDTTIFLIHKKGYNKITIREICQTAEISVGTFYLYFLSKEDVLLDLYNRINLRLDEFISTSSEVKEQILSIIAFLFDLLEVSFDKDLLSEIYRAVLFARKDMLLSKKQPYYERVLSLTKKAELKPSVKESLNSDNITDDLMIIIRGCLLTALTDDAQTISDAKSICLNRSEAYLNDRLN